MAIEQTHKNITFKDTPIYDTKKLANSLDIATADMKECLFCEGSTSPHKWVERVNEWMYEWMDGWMNEWMNEWVNEWINERVTGKTATFQVQDILSSRVIESFALQLTGILTTHSYRWWYSYFTVHSFWRKIEAYPVLSNSCRHMTRYGKYTRCKFQRWLQDM